MEWLAKYWIEAVFGLIIAILSAGYKKVSDSLKERKEKEEAMQLGLQAILRVRILETYNYYSDKGIYPIHARESMESMYKQYKELGGNGTVPELLEKLNDLPTEERKNEEERDERI